MNRDQARKFEQAYINTTQKSQRKTTWIRTRFLLKHIRTHRIYL